MTHLPRALCMTVMLMLAVSPFSSAQQFSPADYALTDDPVWGEVDIRAQVRLAQNAPAGAAARIVFCYADPANHLFVQLTRSALSLGQVREGREEVFARSSTGLNAAGDDGCSLIIKRRNWSISVLCNARVVLRAYEEYAPGEEIGHAARGVVVEDLHAQPIGEMVFHDGFARVPQEPDPWEPLQGTWQVRLPDARLDASDPVRTANPFSYIATGQNALSVTGASFWEGYEFSVSAKPVGAGTLGLAFYVQDEDNHYLFRLTSTEDGAASSTGKAVLVRVAGGKSTVLAEAAAILHSEKWYALAVRAHDGRLEGLLDGEVVCRVRDDAFGEGRVGLFMDGCKRAHFDDVALEPFRRYEDNYGPGGAMPVDQVAGDWNIRNNRLWARPDPSHRMAIGLTGCTLWEDYVFEADVHAGNAISVGLYFGYEDPQDFYLFRWGPEQANPSRERQELWAIAGGSAILLDSRPAPLDRGRTYRVAATIDRAYLAVTVDGRRVLDGADPERVSGGRVGYYAEGRGDAAAAFGNLQVSFCEPPAAPVSIAEQFSKEDTMADWARPLTSWKAQGSRVYSYALPLWGDFNMRVSLRRMIGRTGSVALRLAGEAGDLREAQDAMVLSAQPETRRIAATIPGGESNGAPGAAESDLDDPLLEVDRRGNIIIARLDGQPFAWTRAKDGAAASAVGIRLDGLGANLNETTVTSPNIIDTAFSNAPTDWRPHSGVWEVSDRWTCQPQWSWFAGRGAETPLIWSKQTFRGDMVFEFWASVMMDLQGRPGYSKPSDLNGIICGDGKNPRGGYAFVLAGDNNTRSMILRNGERVAETTEVKFINPTSANMAFHRHWFHCRLERVGNRLTYYVDGRKALEFEDPNPIPGGHVALWTDQGNGMMVARTRIAFTQ